MTMHGRDMRDAGEIGGRRTLRGPNVASGARIGDRGNVPRLWIRPFRRWAALCGAVLALALGAVPAVAHHPLGGQAMGGFSDGLLSGLGHPVLGFDHLFFVLAVGIAARLGPAPLLAPLAYLAAMASGVALVAGGGTLPFVEPMVLVSLVLAGGLLAAGRRLPLLLAAGFGLFHGAAFGEAMAGVEAARGSVLAGYLLGLIAVQWVLAVLAGAGGERFLGIGTPGAPGARLAGAGIAGAGAMLALEAGEGAALAVLGLGG